MDVTRLWDGVALWVALEAWRYNTELLSNIERKVQAYADAIREVGK